MIYLHLLFVLFVIFLISSCVMTVEKDPMELAVKSIATQLGLPETSQSTDDRFIIFFATEPTMVTQYLSMIPLRAYLNPSRTKRSGFFYSIKTHLQISPRRSLYLYRPKLRNFRKSRCSMDASCERPAYIYNAAYSKIKWKNFELTVPESVPTGELVVTVPDNCRRL
ncbi:MAG: hypothetical protein ACK40Q_03810 [Pseudothermotoga sp.]